MSTAVMKVLGQEGMQQLQSMADKFPVRLAMQLLEMWQESNPTRFKNLGMKGILDLLSTMEQMLALTADLEADESYQHLALHEMMQVAGIPLSLQEALGTSQEN